MDEPITSEIAARLRSARARVNLTQKEAERRTGVSWLVISRAERGERVPTVAALYALARAYGVQPADLLAPLPTD